MTLWANSRALEVSSQYGPVFVEMGCDVAGRLTIDDLRLSVLTRRQRMETGGLPRPSWLDPRKRQREQSAELCVPPSADNVAGTLHRVSTESKLLLVRPTYPPAGTSAVGPFSPNISFQR
jgi:hypothetical protein